MNKRPSEISEDLHADAAKLIIDDELNEILIQYRSVSYTGSFYLDLMVSPNIDIQILLDPDEYDVDSFLDLGNVIAEVFEVTDKKFENHLSSPIRNLPAGLHWNIGMKRPWHNVSWQLYIWAVNRNDFENDMLTADEIKNKLNPQNRELILKVKHSILTEGGRTPVYSGYHLYRAVLDEHLTDGADILNYLKENGVDLGYL